MIADTLLDKDRNLGGSDIDRILIQKYDEIF